MGNNDSFIERIKTLRNHIYVLGGHWAEFRHLWFKTVRADNQTERILDAGCGGSWVKKEFQRINYPVDYYGIDLGVGGENVEYHINALADLHYIPFKDCSFDKVFSNSVLEHVESPERVFREMARVTAPGGRIYLSVPFVWGLHQIPYDNYRFTKYILETYAVRNELKILNLWPMGGFFTVLRYMFGNLTLESLNDNFLWKFVFGIITKVIKLLDKTILSPVVYVLDKLDKNKALTLGYFVVYQKEGIANKDLMKDPFRCPLCEMDEAELQKNEDGLKCIKCNHSFMMSGQIPDLSLRNSLKPRSRKLFQL